MPDRYALLSIGNDDKIIHVDEIIYGYVYQSVYNYKHNADVRKCYCKQTLSKCAYFLISKTELVLL